MEKLQINGNVRIYFAESNTQKVVNKVYDMQITDRELTINTKDGCFYVVNMDKVSMLEIFPNSKRDRQERGKQNGT